MINARGTTHWPLFATIALLGCLFILLSRTVAVRVGDGSEYYALYFAWHDTLRPFMTDAAWAAYRRFFDTKSVVALVSEDDLRAAFPALILGHSADLNHFWLFSFVPAMLSRALGFLHLRAQGAFLLFHWILASLTFACAWAGYRWRGLGAVALMFFLSPAVWYADKVHTEFFTICLTTSAVILFMRERMLAAALLIALASTQNISFLAIAGVVILLDLARRGWGRTYDVGDVILLILTIVAMFIHPAYYFFRFGVITPQLLAGGATVGGNLSTFYLWFLDPDLGLLPNWPLVVVVSLIAWFGRTGRDSGLARHPESIGVSRLQITVFVMTFLAISLFAQSSTSNLNSGATPGVARYALWYIALSFPAFERFLEWATAGTARRQGERATGWRKALAFLDWRVATCIVITAGGIAYAVAFFSPDIREDGPTLGYTHPSWVSLLVQGRLPFLYDPPAEVFAERYGEVGEDPRLQEARAIVGPDCRKMLIQGSDKKLVFGGRGCGLDAGRLRAVLDARPDAGISGFRYVRLDDEEVRRARIPIARRVWYPIGTDREANAVLGSGWGMAEPWGVWSGENQVTLIFPCPSGGGPEGTRNLELAVRGFLAGSHRAMKADFLIQGRMEREIHFDALESVETIVALPLTDESCRDGKIVVAIDIFSPATPLSLGLSQDNRLLGVGLMRFRFD